MKGNEKIRSTLDKIVSSENEDNWWRTELFEKNTRSHLPEGLEVVIPPPAEDINYNCFVYVLSLQNNSQFLGRIGWDFTHTLGGIFDGMIRKEILQRKDEPEKGDLIIYRTSKGDISHAGIMLTIDKVISKWSWGPIIRHSIFDVPNHYGDTIEFYKISDLAKKIVIELRGHYPQKIIFFDIYQTLLDVELSVNNPNHEIEGWNVFAKFLLKYDKEISGLEFQKLYTKRRDDFYANRSKEIYHHNLFEITSSILRDDLGFKLSNEEIMELIYIYRKASRGHLRLYPGVFDALSLLSKEYTLSTASHTQGSFTQLELRELSIEQFFSHFAYSSDIGFRKESAEFYKRALEITEGKAADCVMVGDNYDVDVLVPQQLGIRSIWVKNPLTAPQYVNLIDQEPKDMIKLEEFAKLPEVVEKIFN